MLRGEMDIFNDWWRTKVEPSDWVVTPTSDLYEHYVKYFEKVRPTAAVQPMPIYEWGIYITNLFGKATRKRIRGQVRWVRALVLKEESK